MLKSYDLEKRDLRLVERCRDGVKIRFYPTCLNIRVDIDFQEKIKVAGKGI